MIFACGGYFFGFRLLSQKSTTGNDINIASFSPSVEPGTYIFGTKLSLLLVSLTAKATDVVVTFNLQCIHALQAGRRSWEESNHDQLLLSFTGKYSQAQAPTHPHTHTHTSTIRNPHAAPGIIFSGKIRYAFTWRLLVYTSHRIGWTQFVTWIANRCGLSPHILTPSRKRKCGDAPWTPTTQWRRDVNIEQVEVKMMVCRSVARVSPAQGRREWAFFNFIFKANNAWHSLCALHTHRHTFQQTAIDISDFAHASMN